MQLPAHRKSASNLAVPIQKLRFSQKVSDEYLLSHISNNLIKLEKEIDFFSFAVKEIQDFATHK